MRSILTVSLLLALGACASHEAVPPVAQAPAAAPAASGVAVAQQTCRRETKPGTNLFQTVCGTTSDEDRESNLEGLHRMAGNQGTRPALVRTESIRTLHDPLRGVKPQDAVRLSYT